jgi:predicted neuraminidase
MKLSRRSILQQGLMGSASVVLGSPGLAGIFYGSSIEATAQAPDVHATPIFADSFDLPSVAGKPAFTVIRDVKDGFRWLHTPSIIEGRHSVLLASWSSNGPHADWDPTNVIEVVRSLDNGVTWSDPTVAVPPSAINPVFLRTQDGDVILFYIANHSLRQDDGAIAFRRTRDNGITWSEEHAVDIGAPVSIIVNNGLTLPNGDWMISFHYDRTRQQTEFKVANADYVACVAVSSDEGKTWKRYDAAEIPNESHNPNAKSWAVEPAVVLMKNGSLRMIIRSRNGYLYQTTSQDMGKTWSPVKKTLFSNDDAKPSILELKDGKELLMWNDTRLLDFTSRFPLMATLSDDDGETWFRTVTVEDSNVTLDYPTAVEMGGSIKLVYGYDRRQIRFVNLHQEDFKPWAPINDSGSWMVSDGVLRYTGDRGGTISDTAADWLHWSKVVCFLPKWPASTTISVDFRIDEAWSKDAMIAVFPAYQDESNWTGWIWEPGALKAGLQREAHSGSLLHPYFAKNLSDDFYDRVEAAEQGRWYSLEITVKPGSMNYKLTDKAGGQLLLAAGNDLDWEGPFIALGSRNVAVSFDNVVVRSAQ